MPRARRKKIDEDDRALHIEVSQWDENSFSAYIWRGEYAKKHTFVRGIGTTAKEALAVARRDWKAGIRT